MAVWGTNFVVIKVALDDLPPLTFALLRFTLAFFPLAFFLPRPKVGWANLAAYGMLIGAGQFGILFTAMRADITPGLASLVVQTQVFFTIFLSMRLTGERVGIYQIVALLLASSGLAVIAFHTDGSATPLGIGLVLLAALSWASGNMVSRQAGPQNMLAYVVWASLFAVPPLLGFALLLEGPEQIISGIGAADGATWAAVLWQSVGNTMFGYAAWGWLLNRHPAATVAPMALLVPVFGMGASAALLGEPLQSWKLVAFALVMAGLSVGMLWPRIKQGMGT
jgi:O-acetylserine/cysteine efflux transporter